MRVEYTAEEVATWDHVLSQLEALIPKYGCREFVAAFHGMRFQRGAVPQLQDVHERLQAATGWSVRPVAGLMHPRDFLNGLAFKCAAAPPHAHTRLSSFASSHSRWLSGSLSAVVPGSSPCHRVPARSRGALTGATGAGRSTRRSTCGMRVSQRTRQSLTSCMKFSVCPPCPRPRGWPSCCSRLAFLLFCLLRRSYFCLPLWLQPLTGAFVWSPPCACRRFHSILVVSISPPLPLSAGCSLSPSFAREPMPQW